MPLQLVRQEPVASDHLCPPERADDILQTAADVMAEWDQLHARREWSPPVVGMKLRDLILKGLRDRIEDGMGFAGLQIDQRYAPTRIPKAFRSTEVQLLLQTVQVDESTCANTGLRVKTNKVNKTRQVVDTMDGVATCLTARRIVVLGWAYELDCREPGRSDVWLQALFVGEPASIDRDGAISQWKEGSGFLRAPEIAGV